MLPTLRTRNTWPGLVDELFNGEWFPRFIESEPRYTLPAVNIIEGSEDFRVEIAAPGLNKEDFRINLENNVLTVSSEKEEKKEEKDEKVMRREFHYGSFSRSFTLPQTVNSEKIRANHKDGILQVVIPKKEEAKEKPAREIRIS
jgi:HSP20 family protein